MIFNILVNSQHQEAERTFDYFLTVLSDAYLKSVIFLCLLFLKNRSDSLKEQVVLVNSHWNLFWCALTQVGIRATTPKTCQHDRNIVEGFGLFWFDA